MHYFAEYSFFLAQMFTWVVAILVVVAGCVAMVSKGKDKPNQGLKIKPLNKKWDEFSKTLNEGVLSKKEFKKVNKEKKLDKKEKGMRKRMFVLNFEGDLRASNLGAFREEVTALLTILKPNDEVVVKIESGGGLVHAYGLAASQLDRIKQRGIKLTASVDKVAASGGYLMACVADKIIAAPFAIIGSIGVLAQIPNFHRLLKKHDIDFEQVTAGEYKRTLTVFGENTEKGREKFKEEIDQIHDCFKEFVIEHRRAVDIKQVATGEHWLASKAKTYHLVDELMTSDDYFMDASKQYDVFEVSFMQKKPFLNRLLEKASLWSGL